MSNFLECKSVLSKEVDKKGFITMDEFLEATVTYDLTITEVDKLSDEYSCLGVLVDQEVDKIANDSESADYSRVDYQHIYNEIISQTESMVDLVNQIKNLPVPQFGEVSFLVRQKNSGIKGARDRLIILHMRVVLKIALNISKKEQFELSDAIAAGMMGLVNAVDKFDHNSFTSLHSYAALWIQQYIYRECVSVWMHRYYPAHVKEFIYPMMERYLIRMQEANFRDDDFIYEYALTVERPVESVLFIFKRIWNEINGRVELDALESGEIVDTSCNGTEEILDECCMIILKEQIDESLETLTLREKKVIELRFGLEDGRHRTLEEVGQHFGVSRERIRQIEAKAMRKLRHPSRSRRLKDFLD